MRILRINFYQNISVLGIAAFFLLFCPVHAELSCQDRQPKYFALLSPEKNAEMMKGDIVFSWENRGHTNSSECCIQRYEVVFWSNQKTFGETYTVLLKDSIQKTVSLEIQNFRTVFRRHGKYYWRVTAVDNEGHRTSSEIRSFKVQITRIRKGYFPWFFPYEVQTQYTHRLNTPEYKMFLRNLNPSEHMRSFSDLSLIYHQKGIGIAILELKERFFLMSQIGLGIEISARLKIHKNLYFALYPHICLSTGWFSTGLKDYTSNLSSVNLGFDLVVMPKGFVSFSIDRIPSYQINYSEIGGNLRTFQGEGWEVGMRFRISHEIITPFRILGIEFDFARIPIEFHFSYIKDKYTGAIMDVRRLSIGYLLW